MLKIDKIYYDIENSQDRLKTAYEKRKRTPLRIKLLLYALAEKMDSKSVNYMLEKNFCEKLYVRNIHDATLTYAYDNSLSYEKWKETDIAVCTILSDAKTMNSDEIERILKGSDTYIKITLEKLIAVQNIYKVFLKGSEETRNYTRKMLRDLQEVEMKNLSIKQFVDKNAKKFTQHRERAYRFFLTALIEYLKFMKNYYNGKENIFEKGSIDKTNIIDLSKIIEKFDDFYHSCILYKYPTIESEQDDKFEENKKYFQNYLRNIITGKTDISRNFFIAFLIFTYSAMESDTNNSATINVNNLNQMLQASGFTVLNEDCNEGFECYAVALLEKSNIINHKSYLMYLLEKLLEEEYLNTKDASSFSSIRGADSTSQDSFDKAFK